MSMVDEPKKRGLGRGLSALLGEPVSAVTAPVAAENGVRQLPIEKLRPGRYQPRRHFAQEAIDDLTRSVQEKGILQPLLVRPLGDDAYEIIAGERRWRAAQAAMLHEVPVMIRSMDDREALEMALIENLQRQDLSPLEEAEGFRRLMDEFSHTQEELARVLGKSRSHVANMMRLLALPEPVRALLEQGALTAGHARALLTATDPISLAETVVRDGLNVRQTEKLAQMAGAGDAKAKTKSAAKPEKDTDVIALERSLSSLLGLHVTIQGHGQGGSLAIQYNSLEQLDGIIARLSGEGRRI